MNRERLVLDPPPEHDAPTCPNCGKANVSTQEVRQTFTYGERSDATELTVSVPRRECNNCGFQYFDDEAERIRHRAVCAHLGVLPPDEIVAIRTQYGMSQAAFAKLTGLGEASLSRWENGTIVQGYANDRYLRLLQLAHNVAFLEKLARGDLQRKTVGVPDSSIKFRALQLSPSLLKDQAGFHLRRAG